MKKDGNGMENKIKVFENKNVRTVWNESPLKKSPKWTNLQKPPESLEFEKW